MDAEAEPDSNTVAAEDELVGVIVEVGAAKVDNLEAGAEEELTWHKIQQN